MQQSFVRDVMTREVVTAATDTTVGHLVGLLTTQRIGAVPIVDEDGRVLGVVSRTDVLRSVTRPDAAIRDDVVEQVLRKVLWIGPSQVRVQVDDGVVTLIGAVGRRTTAAIAARLSGRVPGVVAVIDRIGYEFDDTALARSRVNRTHPFSAEPFNPERPGRLVA